MNKNKHQQFLKLYEPVHPRLSKFCRAISGNTADAEDLLQDTILNVMEQFEKIKDHSVFQSYIFSVASNLQKMKARRKKFKAEFNDNEVKQLMDSTQNPEYTTEFSIIYEAILSLPSKMAEAMILFHISDLKLETIREIQGDSLSAVKLRLKRGREKLLIMLNTPRQVKAAMILLTF